MPPQLRSSAAPLTVTKLDFAFKCHHCAAESFLYNRALPARAASETLRNLHKLQLLPRPLYEWRCPQPCGHRSCGECTFKVRKRMHVGGDGDGEWVVADQGWKAVRPVWFTKK